MPSTAAGVDRVAAGAHQAVDKIAAVAGEAANALGERGAQVKDAQERLLGQCRGYVSANPLVSLGIALGAGYLLSRLLNAR